MEISMKNETVNPGSGLRGPAAALAAMMVLAMGAGDVLAAGRGGGVMAQSSVSGASRASAGNVNRGNVNRGNANTGNVNRGNVNTGNVNRGNVNSGNVNIGNDVNIDIDRDYGWDGDYDHHYHPIAAGVVIGAVAVTTAAVVGSYYYSLPPTGCTTVIKNGITYTQCGTVYYQKVMSGTDVVYVVVQP